MAKKILSNKVTKKTIQPVAKKASGTVIKKASGTATKKTAGSVAKKSIRLVAKKAPLSIPKSPAKKNILNLYLLAVVNTHDHKIGKGCREDLKTIREIFAKMGELMNFNIIEQIIEGKKYNKKNVHALLKKLDPGNDDVVIFYYSGHGFSFKKDKEQKFPQIDLRSNPADDDIDVITAASNNITELYEIIKSKGARLNIVISDCCNSKINFKRMFKNKSVIIPETTTHIDRKRCEKLFCFPKSSILVAAADKGQFAVSDEKIGSIFTLNFTKNLRKMLNPSAGDAGNVNWEKLLGSTKEKTSRLSMEYDCGGEVPCIQEAIFTIERGVAFDYPSHM
jgi:Caspase domain